MKKFPKPFYRTQRDTWCVQIKDKLFTLAKGKENHEQAMTEYHRLMAREGIKKPEGGMMVELAFDLYLEEAEPTMPARRFVGVQRTLKDFNERYRTRILAEMRPNDLTKWFRRPEWRAATQYTYGAYVLAATNWCKAEGHIPVNPFEGVKLPKPPRRERTLTAEERKTILEDASPGLRDYLQMLGWTGARPGEIWRLEKKHINFATGIAKLKGKTTGRTGREIEIMLIPPALELVTRLAEKYPTGPLFRNRLGRPWLETTIWHEVKRIVDRNGIKGVSPYTFRHSFGTDAIERGVDVAIVSTLMNHANISTTMHYVHLRQRKDLLRREAAKAVGFNSENGQDT